PRFFVMHPSTPEPSALSLHDALPISGGLRIYYEARYLDLQGKIGGFVLQLITGVGKLRVARATGRALALWSERFSVQKRYFTASDRKSTRLNSSHVSISYAVFCLKKK